MHDSIAQLQATALARLHTTAYLVGRRLAPLAGRFGGPAGERGQGTVEYVGLILLVSLLMVGMVAAMKGFQGKQGLELAEVIVEKIKQAVNQVTFR